LRTHIQRANIALGNSQDKDRSERFSKTKNKTSQRTRERVYGDREFDTMPLEEFFEDCAAQAIQKKTITIAVGKEDRDED